jgi:hypothetical protein
MGWWASGVGHAVREMTEEKCMRNEDEGRYGVYC